MYTNTVNQIEKQLGSRQAVPQGKSHLETQQAMKDSVILAEDVITGVEVSLSIKPSDSSGTPRFHRDPPSLTAFNEQMGGTDKRI